MPVPPGFLSFLQVTAYVLGVLATATGLTAASRKTRLWKWFIHDPMVKMSGELIRPAVEEAITQLVPPLIDAAIDFRLMTPNGGASNRDIANAVQDLHEQVSVVKELVQPKE